MRLFQKHKKDDKVIEVRGRIFITNITDVLQFSNTKQDFYTIQAFWVADQSADESDNFVIRFPNEKIMKEWYFEVDEQRKKMLR